MTIKLCYIILITLSCLLSQSAATCNICQSNKAACINSTSFYMCFGDDKPHTGAIYSCLAGAQCSDRTAICIQKNAQSPPSCGDTSKCGLCSAHRNYKFACLSKRIFKLCFGASQPTGSLGECSADTVCDANSDEICVPEESVQDLTCNVNDELIRPKTTTTTDNPSGTTTTTDTFSPTPEDMWKPELVCLQRARSGLFETVPRDPLCKRYISCFYNKGKINGIELECSAGSYFEAEQQRCHYKAPTNCIPAF